MSINHVCVLAVFSCILCLSGCQKSGSSTPVSPQPPAPSNSVTKLDVCDISVLWPVPKSPEEIKALGSADSDKNLWPKAAFDQLISMAESDATIVKTAGGVTRAIKLSDAMKNRSTWKLVSFRIDPGAIGTSKPISDKFGSSPQLRLVFQPVIVSGNDITVQDFTAHVVYSFTLPPTEVPAAGFFPSSIPNKPKFQEIVNDIVDLKSGLAAKGIDTSKVPLGVHPGLTGDPRAQGFNDKMLAFLAKHVDPTRLVSMAFMGLDQGNPEPWIFFATQRKPDATYGLFPNPAAGFKPAQMFSKLDAERVIPTPSTTNRSEMTNFLATPPADRRGVATVSLFLEATKLDDLAIVGVKDGQPIRDPAAEPVRNRDIADFIANPERSHFFNTDCISCHTESTRRAELKLPESPFRYKLPEGVSGVDPKALPTQSWNVRNFGWSPKPSVPTVSMRTLNETAECVEAINRDYLKAMP